MNTVAVYLGANPGNHHQWSEAAIALGQALANMNLGLVYGGSSLGLMGVLAKTVHKNGGNVTGIITRQLIDKEKPPSQLDELHIVESMQERKQLMMQMSDSFIVMPGGLGTLEEAFETWNAIKIGVLKKSIGFLNINGYFDGLFAFIDTCTQHGLLLRKDGGIPIIESEVASLLARLFPLHQSEQERV
ncbi:MAG: TIGR00730 family Rossman fold protein [Legionellaceae bacterium]|nr:TIGR00730 family Rossman fold protein [Legionellaceae bacterium]